MKPETSEPRGQIHSACDRDSRNHQGATKGWMTGGARTRRLDTANLRRLRNYRAGHETVSDHPFIDHAGCAADAGDASWHPAIVAIDENSLIISRQCSWCTRGQDRPETSYCYRNSPSRLGQHRRQADMLQAIASSRSDRCCLGHRCPPSHTRN